MPECFIQALDEGIDLRPPKQVQGWMGFACDLARRVGELIGQIQSSQHGDALPRLDLAGVADSAHLAVHLGHGCG